MSSNNLQEEKNLLIEHCIRSIENSVSDIQSMIKNAEEAQANETKSSAGDKFETSREMMRSEIEKLEAQLIQSNAMLSKLHFHKRQESSNLVIEGSLVKTDKATFLISIGLGRVKMHDKHYNVISISAPIAKPMLNLSSGNIFQFNNIEYQILELA